MTNSIADFFNKVRLIVEETVRSFRKNNDLAAASSLAFSSSLALIPALFLVTFVLGTAIGSSQEALRKVQEIVKQFLPTYSQEILREVRHIAAYKGAIGALNGIILVLSVTPLVSGMRQVLGSIFRRKPSRPFLLEKLLDVVLTIVFIIGISAIAVAGLVLTVAEQYLPFALHARYFSGLAPFLFVAAAVFLLYLAFSRNVLLRHLLAGAIASAVLWFIMRPLFHLFLAYNPGYGFAFGSFKSIFVVIIWLYYSLIVFLLGAEIAASLDRKDLAVVRRLMTGKRALPAAAAEKFITRYGPGETIFNEGDAGDRMFSLVRGSVAIRKGGREVAVVHAGQYFGVVSFLLGTGRIASAIAVDEAEFVMITRENIADLMHESPEFVTAMLREIAVRLRETDRLME